MINQASINSYKLLENLLTWARSQTGAIKLEYKKTNIDNIINDTINILRETATKKDILLQYKRIPPKTIYAYADVNTLSTVIRNLISNALKFTPQGGSINVESTIQDNSAVVSVKDNGVGMTEEQKENLFKVSNSNSTQGTNNETGTGLGLLICKEFVEMNSGEITFNSEVGKGTVFHIHIPLFNEN